MLYKKQSYIYVYVRSDLCSMFVHSYMSLISMRKKYSNICVPNSQFEFHFQLSVSMWEKDCTFFFFKNVIFGKEASLT